jgi:hypothetical protein
MQKVVKIEIKDMDKALKFNIRLFNAMEGLDFIDKRIAEKSRSIKECLKDLLPLATLMDSSGTNAVAEMSLENSASYFESPLAPIELGIKILEHQMVFMKSSEIFRPYVSILEKMYRLPISESQTSSSTFSLPK